MWISKDELLILSDLLTYGYVVDSAQQQRAETLVRVVQSEARATRNEREAALVKRLKEHTDYTALRAACKTFFPMRGPFRG